MGVDLVVQLMRHLLVEAMLLCAPLLLAAATISLLVSLLQTLTAVPRLVVVFLVTVVTMPWMIHRLVNYTAGLFSDFHRFLG